MDECSNGSSAPMGSAPMDRPQWIDPYAEKFSVLGALQWTGRLGSDYAEKFSVGRTATGIDT